MNRRRGRRRRKVICH